MIGARARILLPEIAVAAVGAYFLLPKGGLAQAALYDVIGGGAAVMLFLGPRRGEARRRWILLGIAIALFVAGDTAWDVMQFGFNTFPYPSVADGFYLAGYPFLFASLWTWSRGGVRARTDVIDAAIACIALGLPVWSLFIDPLDHEALRSLGGAVSLAYPVMDLLLIGVAARLWFSRPPRTAAFRLVIAGVVLMLAGDVIYAFMVQYAAYESGSWIDALWLLSYVAIGAAALQPSARVPEGPPAPHRAAGSRQVIVMASLLFVPIGLVAVSPLVRGHIDVSEILVATSALIVLVLARLRGVLRSLAESTSELEDAQRRAALIVENAHDAIVTVDEAGRVTEFNPAAERMFGYRRSELSGRAGLDVLVSEAWRDAVAGRLAALQPHANGDTDARLEVEAVRSDGSAFPAELTVEPMNGAVPAQYTAFFRDITQRRQLQEEQARALEAERAAVRQLEALDELKSTFLTAASHELRTPVAAILGNAKTLQRLGPGMRDGERAALIDAIADRASGLTSLISDLLDVERLRKGTEVLRRETADLRAIVDRATAPFVGPDHPLTVSVEPLLVEVDVVKAERIVVNLVANAVRHTPAGTPISVRAGRHDDGVLVTVEDGGPGVPEELRSAIFEPFRQGAATSPHSPGVGIGLALVQRFAELHGGRAWVDEAPGGGAAFHVFLRCAVEAPSAAGATKPRGGRRGSRVPG